MVDNTIYESQHRTVRRLDGGVILMTLCAIAKIEVKSVRVSIYVRVNDTVINQSAAVRKEAASSVNGLVGADRYRV